MLELTVVSKPEFLVHPNDGNRGPNSRIPNSRPQCIESKDSVSALWTHLAIGSNSGGATGDDHEAQKDTKNQSRKMGGSQRNGDLHQKNKTQIPWEGGTRKPKPTWRDQEVLKEYKKTFGVYGRPETRFSFPSLGFPYVVCKQTLYQVS
jgi:hypothetical protein